MRKINVRKRGKVYEYFFEGAKVNNKRNGVEIKDVADILGHKRIETTENYYISSTIEDIQKASAVLENIIQSDITNKIINFE